MIRYSLKCPDAHEFESWFQSGEAFDKLAAASMLSCPQCGSADVHKAIMAPRIGPSHKATGGSEETTPTDTPSPEPADTHALTAPASPAEAALKELKEKIQEHSEYVGPDFAKEARKIHDGDAPERSIYGEAKPDEARKLVEDGVPVAPLPFIPNRKTN
ncbi:MAG: DUF1178 family protein [Marinosulfonomonas sp.]|nr:DUF1178 family protein [Marinosulfonomonas sp.]